MQVGVVIKLKMIFYGYFILQYPIKSISSCWEHSYKYYKNFTSEALDFELTISSYRRDKYTGDYHQYLLHNNEIIPIQVKKIRHIFHETI